MTGHRFQTTANHGPDGLGADRPREELIRIPVLTLWQPWASLIMFGGKTVENRSWAPPSYLIGQRLGIHAGQKYDGLMIDRVNDEKRMKLPFGAIIGTVLLIGHGNAFHPEMTDNDREWYNGPVGWLLRDPRPFEAPIEIKGRQGIWFHNVSARLVDGK